MDTDFRSSNILKFRPEPTGGSPANELLQGQNVLFHIWTSCHAPFFLKLLPNLFAKDNLSDTSDFNVFIGCKQKMFCKCAVYRQVQFGCHDTDVTKSFYKVYF